MSRFLRWLSFCSETLYRLFIFGYPASFRREYGRHMAQLFRDSSRDAYRQRGLLGLFWLWLHVLGDLITTIPKEHLAEVSFFKGVEWRGSEKYSSERDKFMSSKYEDIHPFGERLAEVLGKEPAYYQLLVSTVPTPRMTDVVESLALEGDPHQPQTMLTLFQALAEETPVERVDRWLVGLRDVARRIYQNMPPDDDPQLTDEILRQIYADPRLYELLAATEPGYGLLDIVESLALEANIEEIEDMLSLMHQLVI